MMCWHEWGKWSAPTVVRDHRGECDTVQFRDCRKCYMRECRIVIGAQEVTP